jgi:hypothetical protein
MPKCRRTVRRMKHVTFGEKTVLVGDAAADALIEYGAAVARTGSADVVRLRVVSASGEDAVATFLLDSGTSIVTETVSIDAAEPENRETVDRIRERLERLAHEDSPSNVEVAGETIPRLDDFEY